ncbi:MAG: asparagine synthase C-terminal domain-containing protein, partial [Bacteroidota bacterium]
AIFDYLLFNRTDQSENTFFRNIKKLNHGHQIIIKNNNVSISSWYKLADHLKEPFRSETEFFDLFQSSVALRLRSDVPVGVCLSGGLDSSSIVSVISEKLNKKDIHTFSAVYGEGKSCDESIFINEYKERLPNMFFTTPDATSLFRDLDPFITAHAEPVPSTAPYAQFKVMELAQRNVTVLLDGQGADEELTGYHYFFGFYFKELLYHLKLFTLADEIFHYLKQHKSIFGIKTFLYLMLPSSSKLKLKARHTNFIPDDFLKSYKAGENVVIQNIYNAKDLHDSLISHFNYKLEHLLKWEDRNSMWFSLESRTPFLDYRLVEKTLSLPNHMIIKKGRTKHILRESMKNILPEKIRIRADKTGFDTPEADWFRSHFFKELIMDTIHSGKFRGRGYIDPVKAEAVYSKHLARKSDSSRDIWKWINLELWFRKHIDN